MDTEIRRGCDAVFDFLETYWVKKSEGTVFDPTSAKFRELPQELAALIMVAVQYGAATGSGYFSGKPRKLRKEFAYYLTEKLNMDSAKAMVVAKTLQQQEKKNPGVAAAIKLGREAYRGWRLGKG